MRATIDPGPAPNRRPRSISTVLIARQSVLPLISRTSGGVLQVDAGFERLASKPHLQHPSGQFLLDFKEMLLMLTYLAAVRRLFWLMGKVSTHALAQVT
jgi:hypothetical protein